MEINDNRSSSLITTLVGAAQTCLQHINSRREKLLEEEIIEHQHQRMLREIITTNFCTSDRGLPVPKSSQWWDKTVPTFSEEEFIKHFLVDRNTFSYLANELRSELFTKDSTFKRATSVEKKIAVGLKSLATTCDMITIAALFGLGRSSVHLYFMQFINAVNKKLVKKLIKLPKTDEDFEKIACEFERQWGFPMAVGAIDGTHIPFNPPQDLTTDFHNYKGWNSILTLAICDADGKAMWIKSGLPGRMADSGAFKSTALFRKLVRRKIIPPKTKTINGADVPYLLLGDSGFGMESFLIKPYLHRGILPAQKRIFNFRHSRARRTVESMFGRVKNRWRRLLRGIDVKYQNASKVITAAFALHNLCEINKVRKIRTDDEKPANDIFRRQNQQPSIPNNTSQSSSNLIREKLAEHFASQPNPWKGPTQVDNAVSLNSQYLF